MVGLNAYMLVFKGFFQANTKAHSLRTLFTYCGVI